MTPTVTGWRKSPPRWPRAIRASPSPSPPSPSSPPPPTTMPTTPAPTPTSGAAKRWPSHSMAPTGQPTTAAAATTASRVGPAPATGVRARRRSVAVPRPHRGRHLVTALLRPPALLDRPRRPHRSPMAHHRRRSPPPPPAKPLVRHRRRPTPPAPDLDATAHPASDDRTGSHPDPTAGTNARTDRTAGHPDGGSSHPDPTRPDTHTDRDQGRRGRGPHRHHLS